MEISNWITVGVVVIGYLIGVGAWAFKVEKRIQALEIKTISSDEKLKKIEQTLEKLDQKLDDLRELVIKNNAG